MLNQISNDGNIQNHLLNKNHTVLDGMTQSRSHLVNINHFTKFEIKHIISKSMIIFMSN